MALRRLSRKLGSLFALVKLVNLPSQFATAESNKKPHFGKLQSKVKTLSHVKLNLHWLAGRGNIPTAKRSCLQKSAQSMHLTCRNRIDSHLDHLPLVKGIIDRVHPDHQAFGMCIGY